MYYLSIYLVIIIKEVAESTLLGFHKKLKNVSCEYARWVCKAVLVLIYTMMLGKLKLSIRGA